MKKLFMLTLSIWLTPIYADVSCQEQVAQHDQYAEQRMEALERRLDAEMDDLVNKEKAKAKAALEAETERVKRKHELDVALLKIEHEKEIEILKIEHMTNVLKAHTKALQAEAN